MKYSIIGGGPGGLMSAILLKRDNPAHEITVYERNAEDDTFGFGVVFSDDTLGNLRDADPVLLERMSEHYRHWSPIDVDYLGHLDRSDGHSFAAMARKNLLLLLTARARELDVDLRHRTAAPPLADLQADSDVVIASDGVRSATRAALVDVLGSSLDVRPSKYVWFATTRPVDCFRFVFRETEHGLFWAHIYPFDEHTSTFIVECSPQTWHNAGLDAYAAQPRKPGQNDEASLKFCTEVFADYLDGHPLLGNNSGWLNFTVVRNNRWHSANTVLIGDAAHTAHFSIGSGTKMALEDAIALTTALRGVDDPTQVTAAFEQYESERKPVAASLQRSAQTSMEWFEGIERYRDIPAEQFVFQLLTRSQRITYDNLKMRDAEFVGRLDEWFAHSDNHAGGDVDAATPPMFYPFTVRGMRLANRIVVSPMAQYSAVDGVPGEWHLVHLGSRAVGGAGLVITEMTSPTPEGRITPGCPGLWNDEQMLSWRRITDFVHANSASKIGLQLGHSGPKGATKVIWEGIDDPLEEGAWEILAPSPLPYRPDSQVPTEMSVDDIGAMVGHYRHSAELAVDAGFDLLELHFAHGYLLSAFLSPLTNQRTDEFGGSIENRARFGAMILDAVREVWGDRPISVRISATDWVDGGITDADVLTMSKIFVDHGADLIDVSTGQTSIKAQPAYGRLYQTPFSDRIRNEVGVPTITVGAVSSVDDVNTIVLSGRADLCAIARPHLVDPYWTLNAALDLGHRPVPLPRQYGSGRSARRRAQVP